MNAIPRTEEGNLGLYRYYHSYYGDTETEEASPRNGKVKRTGLFRRKPKAHPVEAKPKASKGNL
jgi:hypothetical protein